MREPRFDEGYYQRFYKDPATRVADSESYAVLGRFVGGYADLLGIEVDSVLDLGCGLGQWRSVCAERFPDASYVGVEISEYLCGEHGWVHSSIASYRGDAADLVICQGVLQYLKAADAERALRNLARHASALLYLEALTREDWNTWCDQERTDGEVYLRPARWYRQRLSRWFEPLGGGLFLPRDSDTVLYELERPCDRSGR